MQEMAGGVASFIRVATRIRGHAFLVQFSRPLASSFGENVEAKLLHVRSGVVRSAAGDLPPQSSFSRGACMELLDSWVSTDADSSVSTKGGEAGLRLDDLPEVPLLVQATTVLQRKPSEEVSVPSPGVDDKWQQSRQVYRRRSAETVSRRRRTSAFADGRKERADAYGIRSARKGSMPTSPTGTADTARSNAIRSNAHRLNKPSSPEAMAMAAAKRELETEALSPVQQRLKAARETAAAERKAMARENLEG